MEQACWSGRYKKKRKEKYFFQQTDMPPVSGNMIEEKRTGE